MAPVVPLEKEKKIMTVKFICCTLYNHLTTKFLMHNSPNSICSVLSNKIKAVSLFAVLREKG